MKTNIGATKIRITQPKYTDDRALELRGRVDIKVIVISYLQHTMVQRNTRVREWA
jgi:hypothetical protein